MFNCERGYDRVRHLRADRSAIENQASQDLRMTRSGIQQNYARLRLVAAIELQSDNLIQETIVGYVD